MHFITKGAGDPTKIDIPVVKIEPLVSEILKPKVGDIGAQSLENLGV